MYGYCLNMLSMYSFSSTELSYLPVFKCTLNIHIFTHIFLVNILNKLLPSVKKCSVYYV